jgi:hypothetical protein
MSGGFVLHGSPHSLYTYKVALVLRSSFRDPMVNDRERRRVYRDTLRPRCCALLKLPFSGSVFPARVGGARRSVLLRAARSAETTRANNATEGIVAGTESGRAMAMSARRRRRTTAFRPDHAMRFAHRG